MPKHQPGTSTSQSHLHSNYGALPKTGYVRISDLRPILPFSDCTVWRMVKRKTFPQPLKLSSRMTAWRAEDIWEYLADPVNYHAEAA